MPQSYYHDEMDLIEHSGASESVVDFINTPSSGNSGAMPVPQIGQTINIHNILHSCYPAQGEGDDQILYLIEYLLMWSNAALNYAFSKEIGARA